MSDLADRFKRWAPIMDGCTCETCMVFNEVLAALSPPEPTEGMVNFLRQVHATLGKRFPRCRDCADDGPICPSSGLPCDLKSEFDAIYAALRAIPLQDHGWQDIGTAPKDRSICVARLGGHCDDGTAYFYRALGHYGSLTDGFFHVSHGELYGDPELWAPYPGDPTAPAMVAEEQTEVKS